LDQGSFPCPRMGQGFVSRQVAGWRVLARVAAPLGAIAGQGKADDGEDMPPKLSAGILLYRITEQGAVEVRLAHMGGPFWQRKDAGAWSIPKGEHMAEEDALQAARREFQE